MKTRFLHRLLVIVAMIGLTGTQSCENYNLEYPMDKPFKATLKNNSNEDVHLFTDVMGKYTEDFDPSNKVAPGEQRTVTMVLHFSKATDHYTGVVYAGRNGSYLDTKTYDISGATKDLTAIWNGTSLSLR
ncbi:MAG: hypothetical protein R6V75_07205 [Bacteroidales bacterium]